MNLVLTYQCQWVCVDQIIHPESIEQLYAAPEVSSFQVKTAAADWWSYGAILFELLSGEVGTEYILVLRNFKATVYEIGLLLQTLYSCHPGGLHSYSTLHIPNSVPEEGASLLQQVCAFYV